MLTLQNLGYEVESHDIFSNVNFSISSGDKAGLIGPNGAGKSTILKILSGEIEPSTGDIIKEDVEVGLLPQDLNEWLDQSVYDFLEVVTGVKSVKDEYAEAELQYAQNPDEKTLVLFCDAAEKLGHFRVDSFESTVERAIKKAGLSPDLIDSEIGRLSGGQRTRVALAAIMSAPYDVILLDEPTNNLDLEGMVILEKFIKGSNASFLIVSHDRRFLRTATTRIIELLGGDKGVNQYRLGYDEYVEARARAYESEVRRYEEHKIAIKSLEASVRDKKVKANSAERGSRARSDNDKLGANHRAGRAAGHLASQAVALEARLERLKKEAPNMPQEPISLDFMFPEAESSTSNLLAINNLTIVYESGETEVTFGPYNLQVKNGERVAIIGPNGVGKSTLIKAIMGVNEPASGECRLSSSARVAYIDQGQSLPDDEKNPLENLQILVTGTSKEEAVHLLRLFNLKREQITGTRVGNLSGGERAKILLASVAAKKANLLVLDEPTNNLDIPTIEGLQDALKSYKGAILLVSHDRDFIDGIGIDKTIELS